MQILQGYRERRASQKDLENVILHLLYMAEKGERKSRFLGALH